LADVPPNVRDRWFRGCVATRSTSLRLFGGKAQLDTKQIRHDECRHGL
jgi:hypothetical protein